ncbi:hypothetical protein PHJA_001543300 [Phtheirospermum japonicum]|uniref:Uncharacterized protein n=1 Tax=Phtheirospermum japonicum TaxID=374723 RepID=A0A830C4I6_9LAMI|nr:hypothetical protein PHJA_001543300 [Phtheirospermum japonicum]
MRKISGQLISSNPVSLFRAANHINQFAAVDNGSSAAVALYLQRTADAFNHLVRFHKRSKSGDVDRRPGRKRARDSETDSLEKNPDEKPAKYSKNRANPNEDEVKNSKIEEKEQRRKKDKKIVNEFAETNPNDDEVQNSKSEEKEQIKAEKKKKKKRKNEDS